MTYRKASVEKLIAACRLLLSPTAPEQDDPFSTDFTQDDDALAAMRVALDELASQEPTAHRAASPGDREAQL